MLRLQEEFGISTESEVVVSSDIFTDLEICDAMESMVDIDQLETSIEQTEYSMDQIDNHVEKLANVGQIVEIANEDNTLTDNTINMLNVSMEASLMTLGLPSNVIHYDENDINSSLEAKDGLVKRMVDTSRKIFKKLSLFVRRMLMKIITTLSFTQKTLDKLKKAFFNSPDNTPKEFDEKTAKILGKKFATLAIISGKRETYSLTNIEKYLQDIADSDPLLLNLKDAAKNIVKLDEKDMEKLLKEDSVAWTEKMFEEKSIMVIGFKELKYFDPISLSETDKDFDLFKTGPLRVDGSKLTIIVSMKNTVLNHTFTVVKTTKVKKDTLSKLKITEVPTQSQMELNIVLASSANKDMKSYIDNVFKGEESVEKIIDGYYDKIIESNSDDLFGIEFIKTLQNMAPKLAQAGVMNKFRNIRNIIALATATAKVRGIKI